MKYTLFFIALLSSAAIFGQQAFPDITGTWKAVSKIETETTEGTVTEQDQEIYKDGEKTYTFNANMAEISQGFGKHAEKLPLHIQGNQLFLGKREKQKQPYILSIIDNRLVLTKTKQKLKKGKTQVVTEVVTLER